MELIVKYHGTEVLRTYLKEALFPLCADFEHFYLGHITKELMLLDHPKVFGTYRGEEFKSNADVFSSVSVFVAGSLGSTIKKVLLYCLLTSAAMAMVPCKLLASVPRGPCHCSSSYQQSSSHCIQHSLAWITLISNPCGFVVDRMAMGEIFHRALIFCDQLSFHQCFTLIYRDFFFSYPKAEHLSQKCCHIKRFCPLRIGSPSFPCSLILFN